MFLLSEKCFFLNFGGEKNKYCNLSDMNFFLKNMKNRYSDPYPDPLWNRIRIHFFQMWIRGFGSTFPKCGSQDLDPDPRQNEMDPKRRREGKHLFFLPTEKHFSFTSIHLKRRLLHQLHPVTSVSHSSFQSICQKIKASPVFNPIQSLQYCQSNMQKLFTGINIKSR